MKKIAMIVAMAAVCMGASAQKTVIKEESYSSTQARLVEVTAKSYVKPLIVDLVVAKGQKIKTFERDYPINLVRVGMNGNPDNLRSRAVFDATTEWGCDAVVGSTFAIDLVGSAYHVIMKGFPANFDADSWHPIDTKDYEWLRIEKGLTEKKDLNDQGAVISRVRK